MNQAGMKVVGTGRVVMEGLPFISSCHSTSPTIAHFPAKAIYPSIDERAGAPSEEESGDLDEAEDSGVAASKTSVTCDNPVIFDWSSYDGTNAPPGGTLTP